MSEKTSIVSILRAMALNYGKRGHSWDRLDGEAVTKAADQIDALHAEAEALRVVLHEIASVNPAQRGIEWAKSYACDGLKGAGSELCARWLDTFKEAEALRAENGHWKGMHASSMALRMSVEFERDELRTELEALQAENARLRMETIRHADD